MIVDISNEVLTDIKTTLTGVKVLSEYPSTEPTFPCVVFSEMSNNSYIQSKDSAGQHHSLVSFEINIFSNEENKISQVKDIRNRIDSIMSTKYNMFREFSGTIPNFLDNNIYRYILRYSCLIDSNRKVYRG